MGRSQVLPLAPLVGRGRNPSPATLGKETPGRVSSSWMGRSQVLPLAPLVGRGRNPSPATLRKKTPGRGSSLWVGRGPGLPPPPPPRARGGASSLVDGQAPGSPTRSARGTGTES